MSTYSGLFAMNQLAYLDWKDADRRVAAIRVELREAIAYRKRLGAKLQKSHDAAWAAWREEQALKGKA